jgi:hypothetical protein
VAKKAALLSVLCLLGALALGTRCIERTSIHVDADGYTHITGEMVNETDIQGTQIMLRGTLYDDQNNVVAQKDSPTCPPDSQPNSQIIFDIRFDNPNVPPYARFDVRPISAITLPSKLADPDVVVLNTDAARFQGLPPIPGLGITDNDVLFEFDARNRSTNVYTVQACAAVYDNQGAVIKVKEGEVVSIDAEGHVGSAQLGSTRPATFIFIAKDVPKGPVQVRSWLWFGQKGATTSSYQFVETPFITIQTITP